MRRGCWPCRGPVPRSTRGVGVHGAAVLLGGGAIDPRERDRVIEGTLDMVAHGLLTAS